MVLKTKLTLGLGFLFLIIFALGAFCSYYVGSLGQESQNILKDNYYSILYAKNMLSGLDDMKTSIASAVHYPGGAASEYYQRLFESGKKVFEKNLEAEKNNITEIHEKEYVETLDREYKTYLGLCAKMRSGSAASQTYFAEFLPASEKLRQSVDAIYDVNMQAVVRKSQAVKRDSSRFINSMAIIGSLCLVLALAYFWYFPVYISTTLSYLSDRMKKLLKRVGIAYDERTNDEAYVLLHGLNLLENKLDAKEEPHRP